MKKLTLLGLAAFLLTVFILSVPAKAQVSIQIGIPLPQFVFSAPPMMIVMPGTDVYLVPDRDEDIFFFDGWWWTLWDGRWYRSSFYDRGWEHYQNVPMFYPQVPPGWRDHYRNHNWDGHRWDYQRVPYQDVHQNWNHWKRDKHWEKQQTWGVKDYKPGTHQPQVQQRQPQPQRQQPPEQKQQPQEHKQQQEAQRQKTQEQRQQPQVQRQQPPEQKQQPQAQKQHSQKTNQQKSKDNKSNGNSGKSGEEEKNKK